MPLCYPKQTVILNRFLEWGAFLLLWPCVLYFWLGNRCRRRVENPVFLLVEPFGLGDLLSLSVMLDPLLEAFPTASIYLFSKGGNEELYARDGRIVRTFTAPIPWSRMPGNKRGSLSDWLALWRVSRTVACLRPDMGIDTRSEVRSQIIMLLCGCRRRLGYTNYLNTNIDVQGLLLSDVVRKPAGLSESRYEMNLYLMATGLGMAMPRLQFPSFFPASDGAVVERDDRQVMLHVGARWEFRQWPVARWAELGRRLLREGVAPFLVGSAGEKELVEEVSRLSGVPFLIVDLNALIDWVRASRLVVCLDSGPMHLAQTLGVPVVALFGPGDYALWRPQGEGDQSIFVPLPCNPCLQAECVRPKDSCMQQIRVDAVYEKVMARLQG
jgi:ADP-heptose:LPS heptosyltransferase